MVDEGDENFNETLRKALIIRAQKKPRCFLESLFELVLCATKRVCKGFYSRKSHLQTQSRSLSNIVSLGQLAIEEDNPETAKEILGFVLENTKDLELLIQANSYLIKNENRKGTGKDFVRHQCSIRRLVEGGI